MAKRRKHRGPEPGDSCPCGSGLAFAECCGPILDDTRPAPTAEALMRSRYSAYTVGHLAHLRRSWHPDTRPAELTLVPGRRWVGLDIVDTDAGRALDATGVVEFVAHYVDPDGSGAQHERSRFGRVDGRWVYVDGDAGAP